MKCNECGAENRDNTKFCANCGIEVGKTEKANDLRPCPTCSFESIPGAKFCANCGSEIRQERAHHPRQLAPAQARYKKKDRRVDTKWRRSPGVVGLILLTAGILFIVVLYERGERGKPEPQASLVELKSSDAALERKVLDIASQFICSCGACGEQPLDTCRCNTAIQERQFIRTNLQSGKSSQEIILAVNNTFGWMKSALSSRYDSLAHTTGQSTKLTVPKQPVSEMFALASRISNTSKPATIADRVEVFSRFTCPCGQCGIDELKDCSCAHPRGAQEVKTFVDDKIREGTYTIVQLVDEVEKKYGGRKF